MQTQNISFSSKSALKCILPLTTVGLWIRWEAEISKRFQTEPKMTDMSIYYLQSHDEVCLQTTESMFVSLPTLIMLSVSCCLFHNRVHNTLSPLTNARCGGVSSSVQPIQSQPSVWSCRQTAVKGRVSVCIVSARQ